MSLDDDIFLQMVALLHHLGLACPMHSDSSDERNLLVPWFLNDYPEPAQLMSTSSPKDEVHIGMSALHEQNPGPDSYNERKLKERPSFCHFFKFLPRRPPPLLSFLVLQPENSH